MPKRASAPKSHTLMYTQRLSHLPFSDADSLYEAIESRLGPKRYAGIIHDHDMKDNGSPVADHVHVMMSFSNPRSPSNVAKLLGDKPQSVEIWTGRAAEKNGFSYLCHRTAGARGKFQYPLDAVRANFDYVKEMEGIEADVIRSTSHSNIKVLLDALLDGSVDREALVSQLSGSEYARARKQIDDVYARRLQVQAAEWRKRMLEEGREITTIWIFGPPGAGKTSLAKKYAEERGTGYFVSGSTRDIFQGYAGQHTVILDELRPKSIGYADLLRITDPHALEHEVMAPARYFDKALAVELIIVTSPYDPLQFYSEQVGGVRPLRNYDVIDGFGQLERRLGLVVEMQQKEICESRFDVKLGSYWPVKGSERPNPFSSFGRGAQSSNRSSEQLYESLLG